MSTIGIAVRVVLSDPDNLIDLTQPPEAGNAKRTKYPSHLVADSVVVAQESYVTQPSAFSDR